MKIVKCSHCGNIVTYIEDKGVPIFCCGQKMQEIVVNSVEASLEKHIPVVEIAGSKVVVNIGSIAHPMIENHHIDWVILQSEQGKQRKMLSIDSAPSVCFNICDDDSVVAVYAYCNLHGLWKKEI